MADRSPALEALQRLSEAGKAVTDSVQFDVHGVLLPTGWKGGHGGLTSSETIAKCDELRRAISAAKPIIDALKATPE